MKLFRISQQELIIVDIAKSSTFPNTFFFKCGSIAIDPPANNADQISAGQGKSVIQPLRHQ